MSKFIIGIDVGATKTSGILFDGKKVIKELHIITPNNVFEFEKNLIKLCDFLSATHQVSSVGMGIAGLMDPKRGVIKYSDNFKFKGNFDVLKLLKSNGYKKVVVDNDANCFTRAELVLGQGSRFKNFIALTLGTGIGGGIVINKNLYRGSDNTGAEFGHLVKDGQYIEKYFQKIRSVNDYKKMSVFLGETFASLANIFVPEAIILGGGVSTNSGSKFVPGAIKNMNRHLFNPNLKVKVLVSKLKNAHPIGAALLVK